MLGYVWWIQCYTAKKDYKALPETEGVLFLTYSALNAKVKGQSSISCLCFLGIPLNDDISLVVSAATTGA